MSKPVFAICEQQRRRSDCASAKSDQHLEDRFSRAETHFIIIIIIMLLFEPPHDKTNKVACAPSEDSDQPGHLPSSLSA